MMKRTIIALVLFSMMLHSASRTGLLSHIYNQRHKIAYQIGILAEIPIAMCNDAYDFGNGLSITIEDDDEDSNVPPSLIRAPEIILFCQSESLEISIQKQVSLLSHNTPIAQKEYTPPGISIFHPPA